jgi:hypothetical protein
MATPAELLTQRPSLLAKLNDEERDVWPRLCQTMAMGEIEAFAGRLVEIAERGGWRTLHTFARAIEKQVQDFELDALPKTLQRFPEILRELAEPKKAQE